MGGWRVHVGNMRFGSYKFWSEQCQQLPGIRGRSMLFQGSILYIYESLGLIYVKKDLLVLKLMGRVALGMSEDSRCWSMSFLNPTSTQQAISPLKHNWLFLLRLSNLSLLDTWYTLGYLKSGTSNTLCGDQGAEMIPGVIQDCLSALNAKIKDSPLFMLAHRGEARELEPWS
jgi:hypothetical protein